MALGKKGIPRQYQIESAMLERSGSRRRGVRILKSTEVIF